MQHTINTVSEKELFISARSKLVNVCLVSLLITGYLVLPMYLLRISKIGLHPIIINHIFILTVGTFIILLRNKFSLIIRTITLIGISLSSSYFGLFSYGIVGTSFVGMGLFGCIVGSLVIGKKAGFTLLTITSIIFIFYINYIFSHNSTSLMMFLTDYLKTKAAWYNALSGFILPIFMLTMGIGEMHKIIKSYISTIEKNARELEIVNRFRSALFNTSDSYIIITDKDGLIFDMNNACEKATGFELGDVKNKTFIETFIPSNKSLDFNSLFNETSKKRHETFWYNKEGKQHLINFTVNPIRFDKGEISHWFISGIDMTEYRDLERRFIQSQKMESIGKLAGGVAHDFNNFLTGIIGSAEMLKFTLDEPSLASNKEYIDTILNAGNKASSLVKKLLNFSRIEHNQVELIDVNTIINDTILLLKRSISSNITITTDLDEKEPIVIECEFSQLVNAFLNLGINAKDAMNNGGQIIFSVKKVYLHSKDYPEDNISDGNFVRINICDTGTGIPKHLHDKIFDPFFTTKEQGKGTGLGLSSVYGAVKRHKGIIRLYSEINIGTKFSLYFPLSEKTMDTNKILRKTISKTKPWNILLVDDEDIIRSNTKHLLNDFSHTVTTAQNGYEAINNMQNDNFDLIILDWIMPQMNGSDTLKTIKEKIVNTPIIISSGFGVDEHQYQKYSTDGNIYFLEKPYTPEELLGLISKIQTKY